MVSRFDFALGSVEAVVVGRAVGVDVRVFPLRISNTTVDPVRFAKLARQVYFDLEDRRLSVLGEQRVAVTASGHDVRFGDLAVFAATDGAQPLMISQADGEDRLWFSLFPDEELVRTLAEALPALDPAPGGPLSVRHREDRPRSAMAARRQAEEVFDEEETAAFGSLQVRRVLRSRGSGVERGETDAEILEEIFAEPRLGGGYFTATGRGRHGERRSAPPLSWLDTEAGRYVVQTMTDSSGTLIARYLPAGFADVTEAVHSTISAVY
jgi:hypothetical protein